MSTRVFVAGASGVLGRRVVSALVAAGHRVTANVRNEDARRTAESAGAVTTTIDLFDAADTADLGESHDAIVNVATSIPTGVSAARRSAWAMNDRLRTEASANLAAAMARPEGRYVGESITFPYVDCGDDWIDETADCSYFWGNETCRSAEASAASVTEAGGVGVALRFVMFYAADSTHMKMFHAVARRGLFPLPGPLEGRTSFVHVDDAARAVVAALDAPAGVYNVAEPDPLRRVDHAEALAKAIGRRRLRQVPAPIIRLSGEGVMSLARSQRISSAALASHADWEPRLAVVDAWQS